MLCYTRHWLPRAPRPSEVLALGRSAPAFGHDGSGSRWQFRSRADRDGTRVLLGIARIYRTNAGFMVLNGDEGKADRLDSDAYDGCEWRPLDADGEPCTWPNVEEAEALLLLPSGEWRETRYEEPKAKFEKKGQ